MQRRTTFTNCTEQIGVSFPVAVRCRSEECDGISVCAKNEKIWKSNVRSQVTNLPEGDGSWLNDKTKSTTTNRQLPLYSIHIHHNECISSKSKSQTILLLFRFGWATIMGARSQRKTDSGAENFDTNTKLPICTEMNLKKKKEMKSKQKKTGETHRQFGGNDTYSYEFFLRSARCSLLDFFVFALSATVTGGKTIFKASMTSERGQTKALFINS